MTRELLLLRHAKSNWRAEFETDLERPLSRRGVRAAATIGRALRALEATPERVLTSPAKRARQTARLALEAGEWGCPIERCPDFYGGSPEDALDALRRVPEPLERILAVGHEPTWSALAGGLVGGAELRVPTACLLRIELGVQTWSELAWGSCVLAAMLPVRTLQALSG
jgi:phosphohistidine phosphatase